VGALPLPVTFLCTSDQRESGGEQKATQLAGRAVLAMADSCSSSGWGACCLASMATAVAWAHRWPTPHGRFAAFFEDCAACLSEQWGPDGAYPRRQFIGRAAVFLESASALPGPVVCANNGSTLVEVSGRHQRRCVLISHLRRPCAARCARGKRAAPDWVPLSRQCYLSKLSPPARPPCPSTCGGPFGCASWLEVPGGADELSSSNEQTD